MQLFQGKSTTLPVPVKKVDDNIHPLVKSLNFDKLKWKLSKSSEASWNFDLCEFAEEEYCKFLTLKKLHPKVALVPSKLVDKFWHEHILDTLSYEKDCFKVFNRFIHHYPYFGIFSDEDQTKLQSSFDETIKLYEVQFGEFPTSALFGKETIKAARCDEGHACHVSSSCACRTKGACK
jgi:hypothetical protein